MTPPAPIFCFGEILWDFLPHGTFPGGAPFNVAYHLHQQGAPVQLVSAVGDDEWGTDLLRRLEAWGLSTAAIARQAALPTGRVVAEIGAAGDAHYTIAQPAAWDEIAVDDALRASAASAAALVFGSLALRTEPNRRALARLLAALPPEAWRVFDVNLRPPHDDVALVHSFAAATTLLKVNAAEAARLAANAAERPGREESDARILAAQTGARCVCVTAGERGAGLLRDRRWRWEPARMVRVADTVGAGDAFLATLLRGLLDGTQPDAEILAQACRVGEWVAAQSGATPSYADSPTGRSTRALQPSTPR